LELQYGNGLDPDLSSRILDSFGNIDVSVSNPPYINIDYNKDAKLILKKSGLIDAIPKGLKVIPAEIIFIAQNLLVIKDGGELGVILPASLINGEKWKGLRDCLLNNYSIENSIQLPTNAFLKTETSTFALCLRKKINENSNNICLGSHKSNNKIYIDKSEAIERMDFSYYMHKQTDNKFENKSSILKLYRGNQTERYLRDNIKNYLHTSDLKLKFQIIDIKKDLSFPNIKCATQGDIVISRVGSRCVGKCAYIKSGTIPISDCLFVIKLEQLTPFINYIKSGNFHTKIQHSALGIGAKYITMNLLREIINGHDI
jgi:type I restriction enzyme M protein